MKVTQPVELVVTRHAALIEYLREIGIANADTQILSHATEADIAGKWVAGVLPHSLSSATGLYIEVPLNLPPELRGVELTLDQVRQFAGKPTAFIVSKVGNYA